MTRFTFLKKNVRNGPGGFGWTLLYVAVITVQRSDFEVFALDFLQVEIF